MGGFTATLFVHFHFLPSGVVVASTMNAPGSWHDSYKAEIGGIYNN
jgi:hypothetical protein